MTDLNKDGPIGIAAPYLLFLGDVTDPADAKTAFGLAHWAKEKCLAQFRLPHGLSIGLPDMDMKTAAASGAQSLVIGVANDGGVVAPNWIPSLIVALEAGLDLVSGLHDRLADVSALREAADRTGRRIIDVRAPRRSFSPGTGVRRTGKRLLTVGTDCAVGKKYAAISIQRAMQQRGVNADFRATGQTGLLIAGAGVCVDAVVADFISGAAEVISPANAPDHWDIIEGQGSLFHPSYAGVSLGLLHGSQPDAIVICHDPRRTEISGLAHMPIPSIDACITENLRAARLTNPEARAAGVCLNTSSLDDSAALALLERVGAEVGLPCVDPIRTGADAIARYLIQRF